MKTLDSGFRRNDTRKSQTNFFTPFPLERGGGGVGKRGKGYEDQVEGRKNEKDIARK